MGNIHDDQSFKIALITEDLHGDQSKEGFAAACEQAELILEIGQASS